ncbi:MAG: tRNA (adenine-N1)-methyltransferase [Anaerolineales bacterium]
MPFPTADTVQPGDLALFTGKDRKVFLRVVRPGERLNTHFGIIEFADIVHTPYGEQVRTHQGHSMYVLAPNLDDIITHLRRETQIIYPKDLGQIILKLNVVPGAQIIEAGTGSGALTTVLAALVGAEGHIYSYDRKPSLHDLARSHLRKLGLTERVSFFGQDIAEGFAQAGAHALFLDVREPWEHLQAARAALRGGGFFGAIVPTVNQLQTLLEHLYHGAWYGLQADEMLWRSYRTIPARVRPDEQMVGHTGYLVFARAVAREIRSAPESHPDEARDD